MEGGGRRHGRQGGGQGGEAAGRSSGAEDASALGRSGGWGAGRFSGRSLLVLVLLSTLGFGSGALMGARMTWEVNPLFVGGGVPSQRTVTFKLTTAWSQPTGCTGISFGQPISGCDVPALFGQLCTWQCLVTTDEAIPVTPPPSVACVARVCVPNAFTITERPTDLGLGLSTTYFEGTFTHTITVSATYNLALASLELGGTGFQYPLSSRSAYYDLFTSGQGFFAASSNAIVPTTVPLCTGTTCQSGRLDNYYSPVVMAPLITVAAANLTYQAPTFLKTYDLDGHPLRVQKVDSIRMGSGSVDSAPLENTDVYYDIDPRPAYTNGPRFYYTSASGGRYERKVVEVSDRTFIELETADLRPKLSTSSRWSAEQANVMLATTIIDGSAKCTAVNPPPVFVKSATSTVPLSASDITEFQCPWDAGSFGQPGCNVPLHAVSPDPPPANSFRLIKIDDAFGFPLIDSRCSIDACAGSSFPCCCRTTQAKSCEYSPLLTVANTPQNNPWGLGNPWQQTDIGKFFTMCFVATSELRSNDDPTTNLAGPCPSLPLCIKIHIVGARPKFVAPTPLAANSRDIAGSLVPGRTDVGACLGYPLKLTLRATDRDPGDRVRIFVRDVSTGRANYDFFQQTIPLSDRDAARETLCGTFEPYAASRAGDNSGQQSIFVIQPGAISQDSVMAQLVTQVGYTEGAAQQDIVYTLSLDAMNGVVRRPDTAPGSAVPLPGSCGAPAPLDQETNAFCRQLLVNMDQVICGAAYDDSRTRYKRWVGDRTGINPDGSELFFWQRINPLGDQTSGRHCWRIRPQAPPRFVSDSTKGCLVQTADGIQFRCTPFGAVPNLGGLGMTTDQESAFKRISMGVGQTLLLSFLAADPNPQDQVTIFVLEDPGLPPNTVVGRSTCLLQDGSYICLADDRMKPEFPAQNLTIDFADTGYSACQKAKLDLQWTASDDDVGTTFRICVTARDDSTLCEGQGPPDATSRGWFGEKQCVEVSVLPPSLVWQLPLEGVRDTFTEHEVFVGCRLEFNVRATDATASAFYGSNITVVSGMPPGATFVVGDSGCKEPLAQGGLSRDCSKKLIWDPPRGSEGSEHVVCFAAAYGAGLSARTGYCSQSFGAGQYQACDTDADCPGLGTCARACATFRVQKCRYCAQDTNTLQSVVGGGALGLGIDTNWMRLWTLNNEMGSVGGVLCPSCSTASGERACQLNCDGQLPEDVTIDNPDLVLKGRGEHVIWVGALYIPTQPESLQDIAARFRTTVKGLLSVNSDLNMTSLVPAETEMCVVPCQNMWGMPYGVQTMERSAS